MNFSCSKFIEKSLGSCSSGVYRLTGSQAQPWAGGLFDHDAIE